MLNIFLIICLTSFAFSSIISKNETGFVLTSSSIPVAVSATGFEFTGRIIFENGDPYANRIVFLSEGKTRSWEYVGLTDDKGYFSIPIKPYTQFKIYAWDGSSEFYSKYNGHLYYNSELNNLYQTPTGGDSFITEKGDVVVVDVDKKEIK